MNPLFQGEVQFRRYSDSSTQGPQVVFGLTDRDELQQFVGMEGKRFMAVLVQIGDDEQPVERERVGAWCYQAVRWCSEKAFQQFLQVDNAEDAKLAICEICGIESRKELDTNKAAQAAWIESIAHPYQRYMLAATGGGK